MVVGLCPDPGSLKNAQRPGELGRSVIKFREHQRTSPSLQKREEHFQCVDLFSSFFSIRKDQQ